MFTGIVQGTAQVLDITELDQARRLSLRFPSDALARIQIGASVCISGVCLTLVEHNQNDASFDVISETLSCTTLGALRVGSNVNFERSATFGAEIGGHLVSGHVMSVAEVVHVLATDTNVTLTLHMPAEVMPFLMPKGFISLDGCSLTLGIVHEEERTVQVHLIPETLRMTTFGTARRETRINVEVDPMTQAVVTTVQRVLDARGLTAS
ncbi:MAG: riboflavin synthase [Kiritimatiellia bacterium]|jgi:riboflavin synthase